MNETDSYSEPTESKSVKVFEEDMDFGFFVRFY